MGAAVTGVANYDITKILLPDNSKKCYTRGKLKYMVPQKEAGYEK